MSDIQFIDGLIVKAPKENAPDFVKAALSIKRLDLIAWLESQEGDWINADIKEAKSGKWYCSVSTFKADGDKPQRQERQQSVPHADASNGDPFGDEIPFSSIPLRQLW